MGESSDHSKFCLPRSRDAVRFRKCGATGEETALSKETGQSQIEAFGCLLLLLSGIRTQKRHCVERTGFRGATARRRGINEGQIFPAPLSSLDGIDGDSTDG